MNKIIIVTLFVVYALSMVVIAAKPHINAEEKLDWAQDVSSFMRGYRVQNDTLFILIKIGIKRTETSFIKENNKWKLPVILNYAQKKALKKIKEDQKFNLKKEK
jgi:hypothetical protein